MSGQGESESHMLPILLLIKVPIASQQSKEIVYEIGTLGQNFYIHTILHTSLYSLCCQFHCFRK